MKRKVFFKTMMGAFVMSTAMSSCVEVEDLYDHEYAAKLAEYRSKWVEQFGEIDPNEDWGFGTESDNAEGGVTRWAYTNSNEWKDKFVVPEDVTESEVEDVLAVFNQKMDASAGLQVNWTDFWVQHVYQGNNSYTTEPDQNGHTKVLSDVRLDQMKVAKVKADGTLEYEHVSNFNNSKGSTMLMLASGTAGFSYVNSKDSGKDYYDCIIKEINGEFYVGFDFCCNDMNNKVLPDGIYNDWILKISPAEYLDGKRIICEDLGTIGDFDFNDIVFDVYDGGWSWNGSDNVHEAVITVRAAGGTLPVFIGGVDVKKALGVADDVMVNTGTAKVAPAIFRIPWPSDGLKGIEVLVKSSEAICVLKSPVGDAPQKIAVSTDFEWPTERQNIQEKYPSFPASGWEN